MGLQTKARRRLNSIIRLGLVLLMASGLAGCSYHAGFSGLFPLLATEDEALASLDTPYTVHLQDDMTVHTWYTEQVFIRPGYYRTEYVTDRKGKYQVARQVWVPEVRELHHCWARIIADPQGEIVYRAWNGSLCDRIVRSYPGWYDPEAPGVRWAELTGPDLAQPGSDSAQPGSDSAQPGSDSAQPSSARVAEPKKPSAGGERK